MWNFKNLSFFFFTFTYNMSFSSKILKLSCFNIFFSSKYISQKQKDNIYYLPCFSFNPIFIFLSSHNDF